MHIELTATVSTEGLESPAADVGGLRANEARYTPGTSTTMCSWSSLRPMPRRDRLCGPHPGDERDIVIESRPL